MEKPEVSQVPEAEQQLRKTLERRSREIQILRTVAARINASFDLDYTLRELLKYLDEYFDFKHSMILLATPGDPFLTVFASHGYPEKGSGARVRIGKGIIGIVAQRKKMLNIPNIASRLAYMNPGRATDNIGEEITIKLPGLQNPKSQVAFPLLVHDELVGVLAVESGMSRIYDTSDEEIISIIGEQAAMAIQKARLYEAEQSRNAQIVEMNETLSTLYRQQQETLNLFMKYVPEPVIKKVLRSNPESMFDGELLQIAVLFCDIRNFTAASEHLTPNQVVTLLNVYYKHMSEVIRKYDGVINQFVGDEIFVTFGAPIAITQSAEKAVQCGLGMIAQLEELNKELIDCLNLQLKVGIGINFGPVVAGNLGTAERMRYSVTGDTVNTGKRIESLTKEHPNTVLVSESIYSQLKDMFPFSPWEPIAVKGKEEKVMVYEVGKQDG